MEYSSFSYPTSSESTSAASNKEKTKKKKRGSGGGGSTTKLSTDPQSVAARQRRHRISDRFKILQSLVPGGSKMDTVSMLEEAIQYVKFLKTQIWLHQAMISFVDHNADNNDINYPTSISFPPNDNFIPNIPNFNHQQVDLCNNYIINPVEQVQVETSTQVGLPYSWFQDDQEKYGYPICTNAEY